LGNYSEADEATDDGFLLTPGHFFCTLQWSISWKMRICIYLFISNVWANNYERNPKKTKSLVPRRAQSAGHDGTRPQHAQGAEAEKEAQEQGRRTSTRED
jgi:hypothetical protein